MSDMQTDRPSEPGTADPSFGPDAPRYAAETPG